MSEERDFEKDPVSKEELQKLHELSQMKLKSLAAKIILRLMNFSEKPTKEDMQLQKELQKQNAFLEKILNPKQGKKVADLDTSQFKEMMKELMQSKGAMGEIVQQL